MRSFAAIIPSHQGLQILRARADEFRQRIALVIALAQENAVRPQAGPREARVLDQHRMQAHDFIERQLVLSGLQHGAAPPLQPAARRLLAFDLEAGAAVRQQKETRRARDDVRAGASDDVVRLCSERARAEIGERLRPANDWAEGRCAEQIVAHLVAAGQPRRCREIKATHPADR